MILNLNREVLLTPLQMAASVVEANQTLPILSNVLVQIEDNNISVTGTNLEMELIGKNKLIHKNSDQQLTVPAKKLMDICKSLPQNSSIEIRQEKDQIHIVSGKSSFSLSTLPAQKFPSIEGTKQSVTLKVNQHSLKSMLQRTAFAMAQNDVRYYLNGILLEITEKQIKSIATDGHRLAINTIDVGVDTDKKIQIIIPRKAVNELIKLLEPSDEPIDLIIGSNFIKIIHSSYVFTSKLIEGVFPDYQKVIPQTSTKEISIDRLQFKEALTRTAILGNERFRGIKLEFRKNLLRLMANNQDHEEAEDEIAIIYPFEDLNICFNVSYLIENLNIIKTDTVVLKLSDAANSLRLEEPHTEFDSVFVIMPMRL